MNKFEELEGFFLKRGYEIFTSTNTMRKILPTLPTRVIIIRYTELDCPKNHGIRIDLFDENDYLLKTDSFKIEELDRIKSKVNEYEESK